MGQHTPAVAGVTEMTNPDLSTWMTKQQVAAALGVSEKTVSRMAAKGELGGPQIRGGKETGETPRPVYDPAKVQATFTASADQAIEQHRRIGLSFPVFNEPKLLAPPAVPDAPPKAKPLPLSELRFKTFLTTDEAVRYSGLPEAVLIEISGRGLIQRLTNMKPYRYCRIELERLDLVYIVPPNHIPEDGQRVSRHTTVTLETKEGVDRWNADNPGEHRRIGDQVMVRRPAVFEPWHHEVAAK